MGKSFQKNKNKRRSFHNKINKNNELKKIDSVNVKKNNIGQPIENKKLEIKSEIKKSSKPKNAPITKKQESIKKEIIKKALVKTEQKKEIIVKKNEKKVEKKPLHLVKKELIKKPIKVKKRPKNNLKKVLIKKEEPQVAIEFNDIFFSYDGTRKTLDNVNFKIFDNEYVCVIGHNGSGKSTISKVLVGLLKPLSGYISVYGIKISYENIKYLRDNVGIIFQNPDSQFIGLTTEDDIAFGLENKKIHPKVMKGIISNVVKIIGIEDFLKKDSISLSGGQKQRVAIASVLATNPRIMIFDESTSMLDPKGKKDLKETILKLKCEAKKTIISITHDMDEVLNADKVIVMEKGKVKMIGKPSEVFVDEKKLKDLALDFPFSLKLSKLLKDRKVVNELSIDVDQLVENICKK